MKIKVRRSFKYVQSTANNLLTEIKYMHTNALASNILKLPKPFRSAV
jgi:hypothetical protein